MLNLIAERNLIPLKKLLLLTLLVSLPCLQTGFASKITPANQQPSSGSVKGNQEQIMVGPNHESKPKKNATARQTTFLRNSVIAMSGIASAVVLGINGVSIYDFFGLVESDYPARHSPSLHKIQLADGGETIIPLSSDYSEIQKATELGVGDWPNIQRLLFGVFPHNSEGHYQHSERRVFETEMPHTGVLYFEEYGYLQFFVYRGRNGLSEDYAEENDLHTYDFVVDVIKYETNGDRTLFDTLRIAPDRITLTGNEDLISGSNHQGQSFWTQRYMKSGKVFSRFKIKGENGTYDFTQRDVDLGTDFITVKDKSLEGAFASAEIDRREKIVNVLEKLKGKRLSLVKERSLGWIVEENESSLSRLDSVKEPNTLDWDYNDKDEDPGVRIITRFGSGSSWYPRAWEKISLTGNYLTFKDGPSVELDEFGNPTHYIDKPRSYRAVYKLVD